MKASALGKYSVCIASLAMLLNIALRTVACPVSMPSSLSRLPLLTACISSFITIAHSCRLRSGRRCLKKLSAVEAFALAGSNACSASNLSSETPVRAITSMCLDLSRLGFTVLVDGLCLLLDFTCLLSDISLIHFSPSIVIMSFCQLKEQP